MLNRSLTKSLVVVFLAHWVFAAAAQQYVYIEAEGQQRFVVKREGRAFGSNELGFLILSRLASDSFSFSVVLPQEQGKEVFFSVAINQRDQGFLLRKHEKGYWALFNRNTLEMIPEREAMRQTPSDPTINRPQSSFAAMLAEATNDPGLIGMGRNAEEKTAAVATDKASRSLAMQNATERKKPIVLDDPIVQPKAADTPKPAVSPAPQVPVPVATGLRCEGPSLEAKELQTIKKKLLGYVDADQQITAVEKLIKTKCLTTMQAMEIGMYFTDEPSRLKLYSMLYQRISDPAAFGEVESQFRDADNINALRRIYSAR